MKNPSRRRGGFTLIELLAVMAIIVVLMAFLIPRVSEAIQQGKVTACRTNLQALFQSLQVYHLKHNRLPREGGVKFFAALIADGAMENTKDSAKRLSCPAVEHSALTIGQIEDPTEWFRNLDTVDGQYSAYAGRDVKEFPLRRWPGSGKEVLICDDNDPEMNHPTTTCVLYADGTVGTFELAELRERGVLAEEDPLLVVGPDSPVEELRKVTLD